MVRWKGMKAKMASMLVIYLLVGGTSLAFAGQGENAGAADVRVVPPRIFRGENGVADVYINMLTKKDHDTISVRLQPEKIQMTFLSGERKMDGITVKEIEIQHDNTLHVHLSDVPDCEKVAITIFYDGHEITTQGRMETLYSPTNVILVENLIAQAIHDAPPEYEGFTVIGKDGE